MLALATPYPEEILGALGEGRVVWHDPYMDARPEMAVWGAGGAAVVAVHSTKGRMLSISVVTPTVDEKKTKVNLVGPQGLLLYFLHEAHAGAGHGRDVFQQYYLWTLDIINTASSLLGAAGKGVTNEVLVKFINTSPFSLTTRTLGRTNHDSAYLIKMATAMHAVGDSPPASLELGSREDLAKVLVGLPANYYPGKAHRGVKAARPTFDYGKNYLFHRAGGIRSTSKGKA
jgi:hypothetical protein